MDNYIKIPTPMGVMVFIISFASVVTIMVAAGKMLWKIFKGLDAWIDAIPIVQDMAKQFKTDSGSSLRDVLNKVETISASASERADRAQAAVETAATQAQAAVVKATELAEKTAHEGAEERKIQTKKIEELAALMVKTKSSLDDKYVAVESVTEADKVLPVVMTGGEEGKAEHAEEGKAK